MLNFFKNSKNKSAHKAKHTTSVQTQYAPNTKIAYDPDLVDTLKNEHIEIRKLMDKIVVANTKQHYKDVRALLLSLKSKLTDHLLKENVRLFVYLKHMTVTNKPLYKSIQHSQHEMTMISRKILNFIEHWKSATDSQLQDNFLDKYKAIVLLLIDRVRSEEEELYKSYRPLKEYDNKAKSQSQSRASLGNYSASENVSGVI